MATTGNSSTSPALVNLDIANLAKLPPPLKISERMGRAKIWRNWKRQWDAFADLTDLSAKSASKQYNTLITTVGSEALEIIDALPYEEEAHREDLSKILELLGSWMTANQKVLYERYKFYQRTQQPGESAEDYIADLRTLVRTCQFVEDGKDFSDQMVRDRLVCGIRSETVCQRLLAKEKTPSLRMCIQECITSEETRKQQQIGRDQSTGAGDIMAVCSGSYHSGSKKRSDMKSTEQNTRCVKRNERPFEIKECRFCGQNHTYRQCPAYGQACKRCGKRNHFAIVCRARDVRAIRPDDMEGDITVISVEANGACEDINAFGHGYQNKIHAMMRIGERLVKFQVDSGASCDVMRAADLPARHATMTKTSIVLRLYDNTPLRPIGRCRVKMNNPKNDQSYETDVIVVKNTPISILGAETSQAMGLININYSNIQTETVMTMNMATKILPEMDKEKLVQRYATVFNGELGTLDGEVHLELDENYKPTKMPLRRIPLAVQDRLNEELKRLEDLGVIELVTEATDWVSALVVTEKKTSKAIRICLDPAALNKALKRCDYSLPTMEDVLPRLSRAKVFTVCDVRHGYWHIQLDKTSSLLTTFLTPNGRYRWKRMPFGIKPASEIFQQKLDQVIEGIQGTARIADDILVWGNGETEQQALIDHDQNLEMLLERAQAKGLKMNAQKLKYRQREISYAGYILTTEGHKPDPAKVTAITNMPRPTDVSGIRRFLGMANFLAKFIPSLSEVSEPLRQLTC